MVLHLLIGCIQVSFMFLINSHVKDHCCKLSKSWSPLSTPTPWSSVGSWDWSYCGFQGSQDQKERLTGGMKRWGEKFSASTKVSCQNRENRVSLKWQWLHLDQDLVTLFRALFYSSLSLACWASVAEICHPPLISNQVPLRKFPSLTPSLCPLAIHRNLSLLYLELNLILYLRLSLLQ